MESVPRLCSTLAW